ncbi:preprotein translocase subunit YajC [Peptococcaceae bacterium SCADC1_2_3]|jgi:preprotein translocase subunit YajC|nr:preprotein translocase subunit YajC [Peptococcaceae bacterium SCADC1_2_3]KFI36016.1 preprotein translocase subunit YajC [Peptococcaceae bacterium SCADC1_2_3]HBQ29274.1 preprotein translocase subunit YajC [Desulfotomaculum sp.]HCJ78528.1 preprotein translocase subunit YajC [Desulfotomaculum sp.]
MNQQITVILYLVVLFALLYFLFIRPQQQRQKKHQEMLHQLNVNDSIVTIGGILGTVVKLKEDTVVIRVAENTQIEILKNAVAQIRK